MPDEKPYTPPQAAQEPAPDSVTGAVKGAVAGHLPIDILRTFLAAADTGNFTHAARRVHRTQAAVSMQMSRLESDMGARLFTRTARGVALTLEGETLLDYARRLVILHDEAVSALAAPEMQGRVRLGAPEDYAASLLPRVLADFHASHPRVLAEVYCDAGPSLRQRFEQGELDLTILAHARIPRAAIQSAAIQSAAIQSAAIQSETDSPGAPEPGSAIIEVLRQEPIVWVTSAAGGAHRQRPLPLSVFHEGCFYRRWAIEACERQGVDYRICFASPSQSGVLAAVRAGLAVAPVGESLFRLHAQPADATPVAQSLRTLTPEEGFPRLPQAAVCLHSRVYPEGTSHPGAGAASATQRLAGYIRRSFGQA